MERVFDALPIIHSLWKKSPGCGAPVGKNPVNGERRLSEYPVPYYSLLYPQPVHKDAHMTRLHLHLLSDSTGETLENIAKAAIAQFDNVETIRHFWPMVRSEVHLQRILDEIAQKDRKSTRLNSSH